MDPVSNLVASNKIPVGPWGKAFFDFLEVYFGTVLRAVSSGLDATLDWIVDALLWLPPVALAALIALLAWYLQRSKALALGVLIGLFFTINQGLWKQTVATLVLVVAAAAASMAIGLPIGIWTAHKPPTFVYLIPILALFGLGAAPGLIVTVIFVIPTAVRMTHLGMTSIQKSIIEAGEAFGATKQQLLWKVELPAALPTIMSGLTQCIMLSLSMVVVAALIGAGGLGTEIVRALNAGPRGIPLGIEAGLAIVILAIVLDRMTRIGVGGKK